MSDQARVTTLLQSSCPAPLNQQLVEQAPSDDSAGPSQPLPNASSKFQQ
jgi:hypothetical protein